MTVLVTGATSFLGRWVISELQERGCEVIPFRHGIEEDKIPADLSKKKAVLIHFGWAGAGSAGRQDEAVQAMNIEQSMETLKTALRLNCHRFLFAGSQAEYSLASAYGRAKKAFADQAKSYLASCDVSEAEKLQFLHMRIFSVYGPGDHENSLISSLIRVRKEGGDLQLGPCTQCWNYIFVGDIARIIADLAERKEKTAGLIDIGGKDTKTLRSFVEEAWEEAGQEFGSGSGKLLFGTRSNNAEGAADLRPDLTMLKELVSCEERSFREGIRETCRSNK